MATPTPQIVRGLRSLRDPARFPAWAYGIVTRQAALWIRRWRPIAPQPDEAPEPARCDSAAPATDVKRLRLAMRALSNDERALIALHYEHGLTTAEVAEALAIPAGTVKSRLFHLRRRLRAALDPEGVHR